MPEHSDNDRVIGTVQEIQAYYTVSTKVNSSQKLHVLDNISFQIYRNEILGIAGESGCGKSTLLKVLLGLPSNNLRIMRGDLWYSFAPSADLSEIHLFTADASLVRSLRWRFISYIPQGAMHVFNPTRKLRSTFRDIIQAHSALSAREIDVLALAKLEALHLPRHILDAYPHQLSGGMRQRAVVALATALNPALILADEPTTALDVVVQHAILQSLLEIKERSECSVVLVTHDLGVHAYVTDRVLVLYAGQLVEEAPTRELFDEPLHPYTQGLIRSLPRVGDKTPRESLAGQPPSLTTPPTGCRFHPRCPYAMPVCQTSRPPLVAVKGQHKVACYLYYH